MKEFFEKPLISFKDYDVTIALLVKAAAVILIAFAIMKLLRLIFRREVKKSRMDPGQTYAILQIIKYILYVLVVMMVLDLFGVKITILLAGSAALLVGIGLGIQHVFNDIVSGIILLIEGSVKVNDVVETEKRIGRVVKIGLRTSKLLTRDDIVIIVPNSSLVSKEIINWTHNKESTRFSIMVGLPYGVDVDLANEILVTVAKQHPNVEKTPAPFARLIDFGNSALMFELLFYSFNMFGIESVKGTIRTNIYKKLMENNINIPFPQRDVHIIDHTRNEIR
jgi:small-conductance mechanosensitive channel